MKLKITVLFLMFCFITAVIKADDVVLPDGMIALTGEGVQVTAVDNMNISTANKPIAVINKKVVFTASTETNGEEIWISDLTVSGTQLIKDINPGAAGSNPKWLTAVGNLVYFVATTDDLGEELWVTDGTADGTRLVKEIYPGTTGASPFGLTAYGDKLMFFAMDEESEFLPVIDPEKAEKWLWITDGTEEGTERIGDTPTKETNYDGQNGRIIVSGNKAFFVGYDIPNNESLWVSDGTKEGTKVIKNINPRAATGIFETASGAVDWMVNVNDKLIVFRAETVSEVTGTTDVGNEIWTSDGTAEGTQWIGFDFAKGEVNGVPRQTQFALTYAYGDTLFFRADDGVHGVEPCVMDISKPYAEGVNPRQFYDINHWNNDPSRPSWPSQFARYKNHVYIQANGGYFLPESENPEQEFGSGQCLWRAPLSLDTILYQKQIWDMEIFPGNSADGCNWFTEVNDMLFFSALNMANNKELWVIKDTDSAPELVVDLPDNGQPCQLSAVGTDLVFVSAGNQS
ncbi:MAG: hypothetical protein M0Q54_07090, partial [Pigmentiphaga sp.]|nr:hypothetical protein [Pigmentiphaga sp.]